MCGFAVAVASTGELPADTSTKARLDSCAQRLTGRGPDEGGSHVEPGLVCVTTRLIQWDEGYCHQPLLDLQGGLAVFNGELFNLDELQQFLGNPGLSEIEVLLAGARAEGPDFFARIDGQYAAVVRPSFGAPTWAARDPAGICPLYLASVTGMVVFGSNIAAVEILSGLPEHRLDLVGVAEVGLHWAPQGGRTCVPEVALLPAGAVVTSAAPQARKVIPLSDGAGAPASGRSVDLDDLHSRLTAAVQSRIRSVGKVACLLSGGIDSTIIAALARNKGCRDAFGLVIEGDAVTRSQQRIVADVLDLHLEQVVVTPLDLVQGLLDFVRTRRQVLSRLGPVGMMLLARQVRGHGFRAVLSGEGADELFAGYDSSRILAARLGLFGSLDQVKWESFGKTEIASDRSDRWNAALWRTTVALDASTTSGEIMPRVSLLATISNFFRGAVRGIVENALASEVRSYQDLEELRRADLSDFLPNYLLIAQGDQAWCEEGVELRPPYLATPVVNWALGHDPSQFLQIDCGKTPLRHMLPRLGVRFPGIERLNFPKNAYRVGAATLIGDSEAGAWLADLITHASPEHVDIDAVSDRLRRCRRAGRCSEAESVLFVLAASLGATTAEALATGRR